ncbi:MAG: Mut7-C RNAse domain-containing protein [Desulfonatronovibrionaceae bacterium]
MQEACQPIHPITIILDPELAGITKHGLQKVVYPLERRASIKDILEALGVPHTEIGEISCQGTRVGWEYIPAPLNRLQVHSITPPFDVTRPGPLRPDPLPGLKFICDVNVGKLAVLLRMIGADVLQENYWDDARIAAEAEQERRVVLSRDSGLLKRKQIKFGRLIRSGDPDRQLKEVVEFFGIQPGPFFIRCLRCNTPLARVDKSEIEHRLLPKTKKYFQEFFLCPGCERIYWSGSHMEKMRNRLRSLGLTPPS